MLMLISLTYVGYIYVTIIQLLLQFIVESEEKSLRNNCVHDL